MGGGGFFLKGGEAGGGGGGVLRDFLCQTRGDGNYLKGEDPGRCVRGANCSD